MIHLKKKNCHIAIEMYIYIEYLSVKIPKLAQITPIVQIKSCNDFTFNQSFLKFKKMLGEVALHRQIQNLKIHYNIVVHYLKTCRIHPINSVKTGCSLNLGGPHTVARYWNYSSTL